MTVGALVDAGADAVQIEVGLASLNTGATIAIQKTTLGGIAATKFKVNGTATHAHRHLSQILEMIEKAEMPDAVKESSSNVFHRLGEAEAAVHNISVDKVHFHEVGAVDSICDIVGACLALWLLGVGKVVSSPINVGSRIVNTEHGVLPVPAPATALFLFGKPVELTTPTGAALAATLAADLVRFQR